MSTETINKQQDFNVSRNGIEIQKYLENFYEEWISKTFETKEIQTESEKFKEETMPCMVCGSPNIHISWDRNYSGYRGNCMACKNNWPES